jgi:hypothetical protein
MRTPLSPYNILISNSNRFAVERIEVEKSSLNHPRNKIVLWILSLVLFAYREVRLVKAESKIKDLIVFGKKIVGTDIHFLGGSRSHVHGFRSALVRVYLKTLQQPSRAVRGARNSISS